MREGWKEYKLKEVTKLINGYAFKSKDFTENDGIPIVKIKNIKDNKIDLSDNVTISNDFLKLKKSYHINYNDILIAMTGSHITLPSSAVGRIAKSRHIETLLLNQRVGKFQVNGSICNHDFLYYFLISDYFFQSIGLRARGAANQANISGTDIGNIKIQLPPLPTQHKIAQILSAYDDLIENNLQRIALLEEQAQLTYEEWFVRMRFPGFEEVEIVEGLPVGWRKKKLGEISEINKQSLKKGFNEKIKYIDIASVSTNRIDSYTEYQYSEAPGRAKRIVQHGDIIWSCVRPNRKSHAIIWKPKNNLIASTGFCVISPTLLPTSYLYQYLTTDDFVGYLTNLAGGAAYPAVKSSDFEEAEIIIPTNDLILKFDTKFKNNIELSWNLQTQNRLLQEGRDILLPRLMMGVVDVEEVSGQVVEEVVKD